MFLTSPSRAALASSSFEQSGTSSWQGSSSAAPANDSRPGSAGPVGFQSLGGLGDSQRRASTSQLASHPDSASSSPYPHYNIGQTGDYNQGLDPFKSQKNHDDSFASYVRRSGQHGFHLQTLQDGPSYTHPTLGRQSTPSALGSHSGPSGASHYFDRSSLDASSLSLPANTRNILNPFPAPTPQPSFDNRRPGGARTHHLSHILLNNNNLTTLNQNMYHGDMDMESYDEDELLSALPQDHANVFDSLGNYTGAKKDSKQVRRRSSKGELFLTCFSASK